MVSCNVLFMVRCNGLFWVFFLFTPSVPRICSGITLTVKRLMKMNKYNSWFFHIIKMKCKGLHTHDICMVKNKSGEEKYSCVFKLPTQKYKKC